MSFRAPKTIPIVATLIAIIGFGSIAITGYGLSSDEPSTDPVQTAPESSPSTSTTESSSAAYLEDTVRTTNTTQAATEPTATTSEEELLSEGTEAFSQWVAVLADGDMDQAWEMIAESSRQAVGSRERFERVRSGLAEGWGSWVAAEGVAYGLEVDQAGRTLLIVSGLVRPEGHEEYREVAVPLVEEAGIVRISPLEEFANLADGAKN